MTFPSEADRRGRDLGELITLGISAPNAIRIASDWVLQTAMEMLRSQILSRRAIVNQGGLTEQELYHLSLEIQRRVARCSLIAAEMKQRGLEVDWEE